MSTLLRGGLLVVLLFGAFASARADTPATHLSGILSSDDSRAFPIDNVHVEVSGTTIATDSRFSVYRLDVPPGPQTLLVSGSCVQPASVAVDVAGENQRFDFTVPGIIPADGRVHYRCDSFAATPTDEFASPLHHRVSVSPKKIGVISLPHSVVFDGRSYRKIYVTSNGWLSFKAVTPSKLPPCDQYSSSNVPANALFLYAGCAQTKVVTYDDVGAKGGLTFRWHLVDPVTLRATDAEVFFGHGFSNAIGIAYGNFGDPTSDGSTAFIGLTTASGAVFPISAHQPAIRPNSEIKLTPTE